jgi:hypothetical protein
LVTDLEEVLYLSTCPEARALLSELKHKTELCTKYGSIYFMLKKGLR